MENRDVFEELKKVVRCENISDMRFSPWQEKARKAIACMELSDYPMFALSDAANYLYGEKMEFVSCDDAQEYFRKRNRCFF